MFDSKTLKWCCCLQRGFSLHSEIKVNVPVQWVPSDIWCTQTNSSFTAFSSCLSVWTQSLLSFSVSAGAAQNSFIHHPNTERMGDTQSHIFHVLPQNLHSHRPVQAHWTVVISQQKVCNQKGFSLNGGSVPPPTDLRGEKKMALLFLNAIASKILVCYYNANFSGH